MMNHYFILRVSSSILASLFAVGISNSSVNAQNTKRLNFCQKYKSLFHLNEGAERKVRITVIDTDINSWNNGGHSIQPVIKFKGIGNLLANELAKNKNFSIVNWSQIKPTARNLGNSSQINLASEQAISLKKLRELRDKYGIEAVLIGTINYFDFNGERV